MIGAVRQHHQRVEGHELADREIAVQDPQRAHEQEEHERGEAHDLQRGLVRP